MQQHTDLSSSTNAESAKALGAFYTSIQVADFLVWWAVRSAHDTVMDPSFGGGVFIRSACHRLLALGGNPSNQVFGVELDSQVYDLITDKIEDEFEVSKRNFWRRDFFDLEPLPVNKVNAIVGNPPFIRYQRFNSDVRKRALTKAAEQGVRLTQLSSSWAPFVIHSVSMIKSGGRLGLVLPMEMGHAAYALPVFAHVLESFGKVTLLTFQKKLFPGLSEDTLLLLAEDKGACPTGLLHRDLAHAGVLAEIQHRNHTAIAGTRRLEGKLLARGEQRLIESLIPKKSRALYQELKGLNSTIRLGKIVDVGIGYVTGANGFFHLSPEDAQRLNIPKRFLRAAVRRGRALAGLRFTKGDWQAASRVGDAGYLLSIPGGSELPISVQKYLDQGKFEHVPDAYKCRVRSPWYSVPHVYEPDAFLTYMSGITPLFVTNDARVVAPNSLHVVRRHPQTTIATDSIAALWHTSLTRLSVEIEGHALGGGMLKLEPTEAENCILPSPKLKNGRLKELAHDLDTLVRAGKGDTARSHANRVILQEGLGLSYSDCDLLQDAAKLLSNRRAGRSATL
jgi:adenine-specific DNA methylase